MRIRAGGAAYDRVATRLLDARLARPPPDPHIPPTRAAQTTRRSEMGLIKSIRTAGANIRDGIRAELLTPWAREVQRADPQDWPPPASHELPVRTMTDITRDFNAGLITRAEYEAQSAQREAELGDSDAFWDEVTAAPYLELSDREINAMDAAREAAELEALEEEPEWDSEDSAAWVAAEEREAAEWRDRNGEADLYANRDLRGEEAADPVADSAGIGHDGPRAVNVEGQAVGGAGRGAAAPEAASGGGWHGGNVNTGVQNLGRGQIIMDGCIVGDGATVAGPVPPERDLEAGQ